MTNPIARTDEKTSFGNRTRVASSVTIGIVLGLVFVFSLGAAPGVSSSPLSEIVEGNLEPGIIGVAEASASKFSEDVLLHVVIHELGHALVREFDLPILGNEETLADAFATFYLTTYLPDRALEVLKARTTSLMIEASEVPRNEWTVSGEHNSDARRAYQIAAMAVAADREKYEPVARGIGMSDKQIRSAADYGAEIHRSWRRVLRPLWMPEGVDSKEVRFKYDRQNEIVQRLRSSRLAKEIESVVRRFDWHSQITISFVEGDGGAGWNRSARTITINSGYVQRFIEQGQKANRSLVPNGTSN